MTAPIGIDAARFLHEQLAQASPALMRDPLSSFIDALLSAEADAVCGANRTVPLAEPAVLADDVSWTSEPQVLQDPHVNRGRILHCRSGQRL